MKQMLENQLKIDGIDTKMIFFLSAQIQIIGCSSSESEEQPHDPVVADVIQAFDRGVDTVSRMTLCNWLLIRCSRHLAEATDDTTREVYNDRMIALRTSFTDMCESRITMPRLQLRDILREFARLSPRSGSLTSRLTSREIIGELLQVESSMNSLDEAVTSETGGAGRAQLWMELTMHGPWKLMMAWRWTMNLLCMAHWLRMRHCLRKSIVKGIVCYEKFVSNCSRHIILEHRKKSGIGKTKKTGVCMQCNETLQYELQLWWMMSWC